MESVTIVGGTYKERCNEPYWKELFGSGLRAAVALSSELKGIEFHTFIGEGDLETLKDICEGYNIKLSEQVTAQTFSFNYNHPLSTTILVPELSAVESQNLGTISGTNVLMFGMIEGSASILGDKVVYDPQSGINPISFKATDSTAKRLAVVLNRQEARVLTGLRHESNLETLGIKVAEMEGAEVVVVKDGANGAMVFDAGRCSKIPVYRTKTIFSIGSGDIFTAVFFWKWAVENEGAAKAADFASRYTAHYCQNRYLPLPHNIEQFIPLEKRTTPNKVYLAGPFFTISERWFINETYLRLKEFGNEVFSPFHQVGLGLPHQVVPQDLEAIEKSTVILAIISGADPGTLFEVGYAIAKEKRVIVLAENISEGNLAMMIGSNCEITSDFTSAIYLASW